MSRQAGPGGADPPDAPDGREPAVVYAATYRMKPDEVLHNRYVESVCFIWTVSGSGAIEAAGETFSANADSLLRLPWGHEVRCRARASSSFHFGVVHVVPWLDSGNEFIPRVAVRVDDPLLGSPSRRACGSDDAVAVIPAHSPSGSRIVSLAEYAVERFLTEQVQEAPLRALGVLLMDESDMWDRRGPTEQFPASVRVMTRFVEDNLRSALTVRAIADAAAVSEPTAERVFARYIGMPVQAWVRQRRMKEAAMLLQSSTMRVREVAERVGIPDAYYFSRVFSAAFGMPPSRYASGAGRGQGISALDSAPPGRGNVL